MKTSGENPKESLRKDLEKDKTEYSHWENSEENSFVSQPADRPPMVRFLTVGDSGRPVGQLLFPTREENTLSVDQGGRLDLTKSKHLQSVDRPVDRSAQMHFDHVGRPAGRSKVEQFCSVGRSSY